MSLRLLTSLGQGARRLCFWVVVAAVGGTLAACGGDAEVAPAADDRVAAVSSPEVRDDDEAIATAETGHLGVVVARDAVDVAADVSGRLREVLVRPGDVVARGDVLARLDTREMEQDLAMARASLDAVKAEVTRTERELTEATTRYERRAAVPDTFSREELAASSLQKETAEAAHGAARAREAEQRARVTQLRDALGRTALRAPFDGTVALRYEDAGATVSPGAPVVRLITSGELLVRFAVPPEAMGSFAEGTAVEVRVENGATAVPARVIQVAPEIDSASQMVFVEARLDGAGRPGPQPLRAGLVARVLRDRG
jgi:RND family efflux transporter MFP subunit